MNGFCRASWIAAMALLVIFSTAAAADEPGKKKSDVEVDSVDVPEKILIQPTPAEIHEESFDRACNSCHNPSNPDTEHRPLNHFLTSRECVKCHLSKSWVPLRLYSHLTPKYKPGPSGQDCLSCHTSNSEYYAK
jgi:hypothetical protein